jgi:regulator of sigma E protease
MPHTLIGAWLAGILPQGLLDGTLNVLVVVAGVGFLIFVHELGHFAVAKWANVKVEAFSLGFGPYLGWRRGETEYRLSLIPLGGYVKMAGEGLPDPDGNSDPRDLRSKSAPVRAAIFSAGVIMNAITGMALFAVVFAVGVDLPPPTIAAVEPGSPAWEAGLEPGDRVLDVDGHRPIDHQDLLEETMYASVDDRVTLRFQRDGEVLEQTLQPRTHPILNAPTIGIFPPAKGYVPVTREIRVKAGGPAHDAGLRSGDRIVAIDGQEYANAFDVQQILLTPRDAWTLTVDRDGERIDVRIDAKDEVTGKLLGITPFDGEIRAVRAGSAAERGGLRAGDRFLRVDDEEATTLATVERILRTRELPAQARLAVQRDGEEAVATLSFSTTAERERLFRDLSAVDMASNRFAFVSRWIQDSTANPTRHAGIPEGAHLTAVNGKPTRTWSDVQAAIRDAGDAPLDVTWRLGEGEERVAEGLERQPARTPNAFQSGFMLVAAKERVREPVGSAIVIGFQRSVLMGKRVVTTITGIFARKISGRNLGGPIAIFTMASVYADQSFMELLLFLGLLSVNLAIINLLPIPILDGGHLLFLLIEMVKGSPVKERTFALAQWVGLVLILALIVYVTFNDILRLL